MLDNNINAHDGSTAGDGHHARKAPESRPLVEREVPIGRKKGMSDVINAWLDGEVPEAAVRRGELARDVELWKAINGTMEARRQVRTPEHVQAQIMAALPHAAPQVITPWWRREYVISPIVAVLSATGLVAAAIAVTTFLLRAR